MSNYIPLIYVVVITYPWHNPDAALIFLLAMRAKITGLLQHCNTCHREIVNPSKNKAKLRDLIAATGLFNNLTQIGFNRRFFSPCDPEIWWMTSKKYRAPFLHYIKLCASFQSYRWIQIGVTVRKCSIWVRIGDFFFLSRVTLKFDGWPSKTIGHLFYVPWSFVHHFIAIKLELQFGNA